MKTCIAVVLLLVSSLGWSQVPLSGRQQNPGAYPETEASAAWHALAASYVRQALKERTLDEEPALNARVDAVMAAVGAAAATIFPRFSASYWRAILIADFGRGATAFPGGTLIVDAKFVRALELTDDELALVLAHEVAHVIAGHAFEKLSFMAGQLGKDRAPTARTALLEFLNQDSYATMFRPTARLQEREADAIGAMILFVSGYDPQRALRLFEKLEVMETRDEGPGHEGTHDAAGVRSKAVAEVFAGLRQRLAP
jgi:predicted Zn-dependent protease